MHLAAGACIQPDSTELELRDGPPSISPGVCLLTYGCMQAEVAVLRSELLLALARAQQEREGQQAAAADEVAAATASTAAGAKQSSNTQVGITHCQLPRAVLAWPASGP